MSNKFAAALKPAKQNNQTKPQVDEKPKAKVSGSRAGLKHIGGYFDPLVSKQLKMIAIEEDTHVQNLMEEAFDLLFQSRKKPMIAKKQVQ